MTSQNPAIWGPNLWRSIHYIAINYPTQPTQEDKKCHAEFILNLQCILPCFSCREHLNQNLKRLGFSSKHLQNRDAFFEFTVNLHNLVNTQLNKPTLTLEQAKRLYQ